MLVVTLGDPWSVNVEILNQCLTTEGLSFLEMENIPLRLVGSRYHWLAQGGRDDVPFHDIGLPEWNKPADQLTAKQRGQIAFASLAFLKSLPESRLAVLTMPIEKFEAHAAGFDYPGQTEFFEALWEDRGLMILAGPKLRVGLATTHVALAKVPSLITVERIVDKSKILLRSLQSDFRIEKPKIAIAGLNPHCGDHGIFGNEDTTIIAEAVQVLRNEFGDQVVGPLPADIVFYRGFHSVYDGILAMYHDQGLGPLKTVHFDEAINLTAGLKHLRVSPDHGPARDLFGKHKASAESTKLAWRTCVDYLTQRKNI